MLTDIQTNLLKDLRADNQRSRPPYRTEGYWINVNSEFDAWFRTFGIGVVEEQPYNSHYSSYPPGHEAYRIICSFMKTSSKTGSSYYEDACLGLFEIVARKDRWGILNKVCSRLPVGSPRRIVINERPFSWDVLITLDSILSIACKWPDILTGPCSVADLGAGWGRFGFVLKQINPLATYILLDIPESLLLSTTYLPTVLPVEKFHFFSDTREGEIEFDGGVWMLPVQDLQRVKDKSLDCLVNIASFQEMSDEYVDLYAAIVRAKSKRLYTMQAGGRYCWKVWPLPNEDAAATSWHPRYFEYLYELP